MTTVARRRRGLNPWGSPRMLWVVTILSAADVAMPQSEWRTVTLELRWERGDWRVDGITDVAGPTPMVGPRDRPWAPEPFADALAGFVRVGESAP